MTEAEYLTKFSEALFMGTNPLETTRKMAELSLALKNSGVETTPDEVRSFVKSMDELSLPPAEQEKLLDRFAKIKQLYGNNITGETYLAAQERSSMAAYGWDEKFRGELLPIYASISQSYWRKRRDDGIQQLCRTNTCSIPNC